MVSCPASVRHSSPDQVAECLDGVSSVSGLYEALWCLVESHHQPASEVPEPVEFDWWKELSADHQAAIVRLVSLDPFWS